MSARWVLAQGDTDINGPHQGGWVDTPRRRRGLVYPLSGCRPDRAYRAPQPRALDRGLACDGLSTRMATAAATLCAYKVAQRGQDISQRATRRRERRNSTISTSAFSGSAARRNPSRGGATNNAIKGVLSLYSVPVVQATRTWDRRYLLFLRRRYRPATFTRYGEGDSYSPTSVTTESVPACSGDGDLTMPCFALEKTDEGFRLSEKRECHKGRQG